jgi:hypothetical protein
MSSSDNKSTDSTTSTDANKSPVIVTFNLDTYSDYLKAKSHHLKTDTTESKTTILGSSLPDVTDEMLLQLQQASAVAKQFLENNTNEIFACNNIPPNKIVGLFMMLLNRYTVNQILDAANTLIPNTYSGEDHDDNLEDVMSKLTATFFKILENPNISKYNLTIPEIKKELTGKISDDAITKIVTHLSKFDNSDYDESDIADEYNQLIHDAYEKLKENPDIKVYKLTPWWHYGTQMETHILETLDTIYYKKSDLN